MSPAIFRSALYTCESIVHVQPHRHYQDLTDGNLSPDSECPPRGLSAHLAFLCQFSRVLYEHGQEKDGKTGKTVRLASVSVDRRVLSCAPETPRNTENQRSAGEGCSNSKLFSSDYQSEMIDG